MPIVHLGNLPGVSDRIRKQLVYFVYRRPGAFICLFAPRELRRFYDPLCNLASLGHDFFPSPGP